MNVNTVKYFLVVCEQRNFTKAAAVCGIAQPSLSIAIQRLEREVGGVLFNRGGVEGVSLTELGRDLRPIFRKLARCADQARSAAMR
jgi:LysR family hydrogen peroxide-inducible transcriptional activator